MWIRLCSYLLCKCVERPMMVLCRAYRSNTLKHSSVYEALLPFFSPVLLFILATLWVILSPSDILELQPRVFYLMVGTAFSNVTVSTAHALTFSLTFTHSRTALCSLVCTKSSYYKEPLVLCFCYFLSVSLSFSVTVSQPQQLSTGIF